MLDKIKKGTYFLCCASFSFSGCWTASSGISIRSCKRPLRISHLWRNRPGAVVKNYRKWDSLKLRFKPSEIIWVSFSSVMVHGSCRYLRRRKFISNCSNSLIRWLRCSGSGSSRIRSVIFIWGISSSSAASRLGGDYMLVSEWYSLSSDWSKLLAPKVASFFKGVSVLICYCCCSQS